MRTSVAYGLVLLTSFVTAASAQSPPAVGDTAADFALNDIGGQSVRLSEQFAGGPVVLRGYPGYQCPICTQQFGSLLGSVKDFDQAGAKVILVYPGSATKIDQYAKEFIGSRQFPTNFRMLLDPDLKFTEAYHLRWNAPNETSYPSSFVIDRGG
jgi:peroxiredoxin